MRPVSGERSNIPCVSCEIGVLVDNIPCDTDCRAIPVKRELLSSGYSCRVDGVLRCETVIGVCAILGDSCVAVVVVPFDAVSRVWCLFGQAVDSVG